MKNECLQKWRICFLLFLISGLAFQVEARTSSNKVPLRGSWDDDRRSTPSELPVSASVDGNILIIQSSSTSADITVVVSRDGVPVFEKNVPASQTSQIVVDMNGWEEGSYVLELRNKWGGYLSGNICKTE